MAEETFAERLWMELDEELRRYDISEEAIANIKKDFIRSFAVGGPPVTEIPGFPGAVIANFRINLYNLATAPRKVADSLGTTLTHTFLGLPYAEYVAAEQIAGQWLADRIRTRYTDERGRPIFSPATEESFREWIISSPDRGERRKKTKPLLDALKTEYLRTSAEVYALGLAEIKEAGDPAFITSQAMELEKRGLTEIAGRPINEVYRESYFASQKLSGHRQNLERERAKAEQYRSVGDTARARAHAANARYIEGNLGKDLAVWRKKSRPYREYFSGGARRDMERQRDVIRARYYQLKEYIRLRGITLSVLNFLRTWHKEGFSGVFREYVWLAATSFIFRKPLLYYLYPPNLIGVAMGKIPVPGLGTINQLRARIAAKAFHYQVRARRWLEREILRKLREKWRKFVIEPLKQLARRVANWLITKLGLKVILAKIGAAIGGAIGTAVPVIGNAIGAVLGAVITFVVGIIVEKTWKPVLKGTLYLFAGSCACLALVVGGMAMFIVLVVGSIFAPGAGGPGAGPPLPPAARVTVEKKSCVEHQTMGWICQNPRTIENIELPKDIRWETTVTNGSGQEAEVTIRDEECWNQVGEKRWTLAPNEQRVLRCDVTYPDNPDLYDTTITNDVSGTAVVGADTRSLSATGILNIGAPAATFPSGWPTSGTITQGPNVPCPSHGSAEAIDIAKFPPGTPIFATHAGKAVEAGWINSSCGRGVRITATVGASTFTSQYCHMESVAVSEGAQISDGQQIGLMNSTGDSSGSHLHYSFIGLSMAPPYIPRTVCCCREDLDGDGSWKDEDTQYCGSSSPGTVRCNASVSR